MPKMITKRSHCECGRPASVRHGNAFICEHCHSIETNLRLGQDGCYYARRNGEQNGQREVNYFKVHLPCARGSC